MALACTHTPEDARGTCSVSKQNVDLQKYIIMGWCDSNSKWRWVRRRLRLDCRLEALMDSRFKRRRRLTRGRLVVTAGCGTAHLLTSPLRRRRLLV